MKAKLKNKVTESSSVTSFIFETEKPLFFIAGQYIQMHLPHKNPDNRGDKRWFTISSSPSLMNSKNNSNAKFIRISTKINKKPSSFMRRLASLESNELVDISMPMGDFVLPKDSSLPLIFVAAGIGATPFASIIESLNLNAGQQYFDLGQQSKSNDNNDSNSSPFPNIKFFYGEADYSSLAFLDTFNKLGDNFIPFLSNGPASTNDKESTSNSGRLNAQNVLSRGQISPEHYIYVAGPEKFVEEFVSDLKKLKVPSRNIFTDYFHGYEQTY